MELDLQYKIENTKNYYNYLKENSYYIKKLNRNKNEFENFSNFVKDKYGLRVTDRISKTIDNIDMYYIRLDIKETSSTEGYYGVGVNNGKCYRITGSGSNAKAVEY